MASQLKGRSVLFRMKFGSFIKAFMLGIDIDVDRSNSSAHSSTRSSSIFEETPSVWWIVPR